MIVLCKIKKKGFARNLPELVVSTGVGKAKVSCGCWLLAEDRTEGVVIPPSGLAAVPDPLGEALVSKQTCALCGTRVVDAAGEITLTTLGGDQLDLAHSTFFWRSPLEPKLDLLISQFSNLVH